MSLSLINHYLQTHTFEPHQCLAGTWTRQLGCHAGHQEVRRCEYQGTCNMYTYDAHSGFETQRRRHQKSKTRYSGPTKRTHVLQEFLKILTPTLLFCTILSKLLEASRLEKTAIPAEFGFQFLPCEETCLCAAIQASKCRCIYSSRHSTVQNEKRKIAKVVEYQHH